MEINYVGYKMVIFKMHLSSFKVKGDQCVLSVQSGFDITSKDIF